MNPNMVFEKINPNPAAFWSQMRKYLRMACPDFIMEVNRIDRMRACCLQQRHGRNGRDLVPG